MMEHDRQEMSKPTLRSNLLVLFTSSIITLIACEGLLALMAILKPSYPIYPGEFVSVQNDSADALIGWKMPANRVLNYLHQGRNVSYQSNSQGFRSTWNYNTDYEGRRIIFLGDSFTFGSHVHEKETFAALLESKFKNTRSYNFGMTGFGLDQIWMTLRHYALSLKPDLVVLSFITADLERSLTAYRSRPGWMQKPMFRLSEHRLVPMTQNNRPNPVWLFVQRRSRLFELWRRVEWHLSMRYGIGYPWRLNRAIFAAIRDECRAAGAPLIVVYIPTENGLRRVPMLEREFRNMGINFLDLSTLEPSNPESLYIKNDGHLNALGHRFVADAIFGFLIERGLSPVSRSFNGEITRNNGNSVTGSPQLSHF
jgi:hypothetical protein